MDGLHMSDAEYAAYLLRQASRSQDGGLKPRRPMAEEALLQHVRAVARRHGWLVYHTRDARRSDKGFPDLLATNGRRLLAMECKSQAGKLTPEQAQWLNLLAHTGKCETYIIRPSDVADLERLFSEEAM